VISFTKMQGLGNDFVVVDLLSGATLHEDREALARKICDRRFGVGADGLLVLEGGAASPLRMTIQNADGSRPEMCGNGLRCAAHLLREHGHTTGDQVAVETDAGVLDVSFTADGQILVDVGPALFRRGEIGMTGAANEEFIQSELGDGFIGTAVSIGNPHLVIFTDDVDRIDLAHVGPLLENHRFFPNRINVHFAQVLDRQTIRQRTWERGAGITLACGTGACAVAVAAFRTNRADPVVQIRLRGGNLAIDASDLTHILMTGPAEVVYEGEYEA
jgi:diaminopimelate epimerase